jgi:hypothetical protein
MSRRHHITPPLLLSEVTIWRSRVSAFLSVPSLPFPFLSCPVLFCARVVAHDGAPPPPG